MIERRCITVLLRVFLTCIICGIGYGLMQLPAMVMAYKQGAGDAVIAKRFAKKKTVDAVVPFSPSEDLRWGKYDKPEDMESPVSNNCRKPERNGQDDPVVKALKTVIDPELGINIVDLGLIRNIEDPGNGNLILTMIPTSPLCPYLKHLVAQIKRNVPKHAPYRAVTVKIDIQQRWTPEYLSEQGRKHFFGAKL